MNPRTKSLILLLAGAALGSLATAMLFTLCSSEPNNDSSSNEPALEDGGSNDSHGKIEDSPDLVFAPEGECLLTGTVHRASGEPVEGAQVRLRLMDRSWNDSQTDRVELTDKDGRFSFENLSEKERYQLWTWSSGNAITDYEEAVCGAVTHMILHPGASLQLEVVDESGAPVKAEVTLGGSNLWPARRAVTDDSGNLHVQGLSSGLLVIHAVAADLAYMSPDPVEISEGDKLTKTLVLTRAKAASVQVSSPSGPVKDAVIVVGDSTTALLQRVFITDKSGAAKIPGVARQSYASVYHPQFPRTPPRQITPGETLKISLSPGGSASGRVTSADGTPIQGASLTMKRKMGTAVADMAGTRSSRFSRSVFAAAGAGWPWMTPSDGIHLSGPVTLTVPPGKDMSKTRTGARWNPTDKDGRFEISGLPAGEIFIDADKEGYVSTGGTEATVVSGGIAKGLTIVLRRGTTTKVRTLNESGYPIRDATVSVYDPDDELISSVVTGTDGYAVLKGMPRTFKVEAFALGFLTAVAKVEGQKKEELEIELTLPPADKTIHGRVVDDRGFGVEGVAIEAKSISRGIAQVILSNSNDDGTFTLNGAGAGPYHVLAKIDGKARAQVGDADYREEVMMVVSDQASGPVIIEPGDYPIQPNEYESPEGLPSLNEPQGDWGQGGEDPSGVIAVSHVDGEGSISTPYGEADRLVVTGPPSGKGGLPIALAGGPGNVVVKSVAPGSLVEGAGLSPGDKVLAVDGVRVKGPAHAKKAILGKIGTVVVLEVLHGGEPVSVVVQRVRVP